jgi:hypothetical protein
MSYRAQNREGHGALYRMLIRAKAVAVGLLGAMPNERHFEWRSAFHSAIFDRINPLQAAAAGTLQIERFS